MQLRQILRRLGKTNKGRVKLREILLMHKSKMRDREFQILKYTYLKKLSPFNVSEKLGFSYSHYYNILNMALAKFESFLDKNLLLELIQII